MRAMENKSEILFYTAENGKTKIQVRLEDETVWLTQKQIAELFDKSRVTITEHIKNVFAEGELDENSVCRNFRHTTSHISIWLFISWLAYLNVFDSWSKKKSASIFFLYLPIRSLWM